MFPELASEVSFAPGRCLRQFADPRVPSSHRQLPPRSSDGCRGLARPFDSHTYLLVEDVETLVPRCGIVQPRLQEIGESSDCIGELYRLVGELHHRAIVEEARTHGREIDLHTLASASSRLHQRVPLVETGRQRAVGTPLACIRLALPYCGAKVENERNDSRWQLTSEDGHRRPVEPADIFTDVGAEGIMGRREGELELHAGRFVSEKA